MDRFDCRVPAALQEVPCRQFKHGTWREFSDVVTPEHSLFIKWQDDAPRELLTFPEECQKLVLGHARLEYCTPAERPVITHKDGNVYHMRAEKTETCAPANRKGQGIPAPTILDCMREFIASEGKWEATGCFHRAAVWNPQTGTFIAQAEDIGRHNCIDRLAGDALLRKASLDGMFLFVSARATASLVRKAVRAGFAAMVSRSAVTTAGIANADEAGMALAGFAREIRFTVFTDKNGQIQDSHRGE